MEKNLKKNKSLLYAPHCVNNYTGQGSTSLKKGVTQHSLKRENQAQKMTFSVQVSSRFHAENTA